MNYEMIRGFIRQESERVNASRKHNRVAKVTSYDPKTYSVKIQFWPFKDSKPDDSESGWIPLEVQATGNGFGVYHAPNVGDLVELDHSGGDHMTARVRSRHVTEQAQQPYEIPAGEYHVVHQSGAVSRYLKDGTVFMGGAGTVPPPAANPNSQSNTGQAPQAPPSQPNAKQTMTMTPDGKMAFTTPNGDFTVTSGADVRIAPGNNKKVYIG